MAPPTLFWLALAVMGGSLTLGYLAQWTVYRPRPGQGQHALDDLGQPPSVKYGKSWAWFERQVQGVWRETPPQPVWLLGALLLVGGMRRARKWAGLSPAPSLSVSPASGSAARPYRGGVQEVPDGRSLAAKPPSQPAAITVADTAPDTAATTAVGDPPDVLRLTPPQVEGLPLGQPAARWANILAKAGVIAAAAAALLTIVAHSYYPQPADVLADLFDAEADARLALARRRPEDFAAATTRCRELVGHLGMSLWLRGYQVTPHMTETAANLLAGLETINEPLAADRPLSPEAYNQAVVTLLANNQAFREAHAHLRSLAATSAPPR